MRTRYDIAITLYRESFEEEDIVWNLNDVESYNLGNTSDNQFAWFYQPDLNRYINISKSTIKHVIATSRQVE